MYANDFISVATTVVSCTASWFFEKEIEPESNLAFGSIPKVLYLPS